MIATLVGKHCSFWRWWISDRPGLISHWHLIKVIPISWLFYDKIFAFKPDSLFVTCTESCLVPCVYDIQLNSKCHSKISKINLSDHWLISILSFYCNFSCKADHFFVFFWQLKKNFSFWLSHIFSAKKRWATAEMHTKQRAHFKWPWYTLAIALLGREVFS